MRTDRYRMQLLELNPQCPDRAVRCDDLQSQRAIEYVVAHLGTRVLC